MLLSVNVIESPKQIVSLESVKEAVGWVQLFTVIWTESMFVQPFKSVPVTV